MATADSIRVAAGRRSIDVERELARLEEMPPRELREEFARVFGEATNAKNKRWLVKRIIWRLQANAEGGLSERALRRAAELANDADLRTTPPRATPVRTVEAGPERDPRIPMPPSDLTRVYKGRTISVRVRVDGFEWEGEVYPSLSAVVKAITGSHWNGFRFFGLDGRAYQ